MNKLIVLFLLLSFSLLGGSNLIKDDKMKKFEKYWYFGKKTEFKYVTPEIRKGEFKISTKHSSEPTYMALRTAVKIKYKQSYKLTFEAKMEGEGQMQLRAQVGYDNYDGKRSKAKRLNNTIIQGLGKIYKPEDGEWKKITCHFTVDKETPRAYISEIVYRLGAFEGDITLRNFDLVLAKDEKKEKNGSMQVSNLSDK
ncbi:hypothetical protein PQO03_05530 [Lentisphaera profundi]|uniref:CBM-cenC domain-containing protein n=1 Tax=Lentisphaera profundi TaxID=1658616 RepID=A0ABY7VT93_9BACT|nr:hypothetical protein [Lentisphaera profundi]WDE97410.1 hypothetical protein PQO03_05530 [Lentisphaera profundi]